MRMYRVSVTIPANKFAVVAELMAQEGSDLEVREMGKALTRTGKDGSPVTRNRRPGLEGALIAMLPNMGATITNEQFQKMVTAAGYNPATHSSMATKFTRGGVLERLPGRAGGFRVIGKTVKEG